MYEVRLELNAGASLSTLAAPGGAGAAHVPAGMVGFGPGIYLVNNQNTHTLYAGISTNINTRFTGRMGVVNELGFAPADLTNIRAWWGTARTRTIPNMGAFPEAFPAHLANLAPAYAYGYPPGGTPPSHLLAPIPPVAGIPALMTAARNWALGPINAATWTYRAWVAAAGPIPKTLAALTAAWPTLGGFAPPGPLPFLVGMVCGGHPTALAAALAVFNNMTAPGAPAAALTLGNALNYYGGGGAAAGVTDIARAVHIHFGGPALPANPAIPPLVQVNPVHLAGGVTQLHDGPINLERIFIRHAGWHMPAWWMPMVHITNGVHTAPMPFPGLVHPVCITMRRSAGGIAPFDLSSMIWWNGNL